MGVAVAALVAAAVGAGASVGTSWPLNIEMRRAPMIAAMQIKATTSTMMIVFCRLSIGDFLISFARKFL
jgi:hypothetical protein